MNDDWRKATASAAADCVEAASGIRVRDSKHPGLVLEFGTAAWTAFLATVKGGTR